MWALRSAVGGRCAAETQTRVGQERAIALYERGHTASIGLGKRTKTRVPSQYTRKPVRPLICLLCAAPPAPRPNTVTAAATILLPRVAVENVSARSTQRARSRPRRPPRSPVSRVIFVFSIPFKSVPLVPSRHACEPSTVFRFYINRAYRSVSLSISDGRCAHFIFYHVSNTKIKPFSRFKL